ncbi:MAG: phenylalanine 4-monooxygenase [Cytophagaceae bacterium]|nr:phenylalanine 4-monooxygenase [Cytophagaceae bacterium]MDW8456566.1 phenylalanine 4-monooxygenase [Cytophagaceae bacterium]
MMKEIDNHYTDQEHYIWTSLFVRCLQFLPDTAHKSVLEGLNIIGYPTDHIPDFDEINHKLSLHTDWQVVPMEVMVEDSEFISMLASKRYPCRKWLRSNAQFEAELDEYDMFHDIIGHTPLLIQKPYSEYLTNLGSLALQYLKHENILSLLKRVYWHTIQFGLITDGNTLKTYGAHLLTSPGETSFSMSAGVPKYDHNLDIIHNTPYKKGSYQEKYFVVNSFEQLCNSIDGIKKMIDQILKN